MSNKLDYLDLEKVINAIIGVMQMTSNKNRDELLSLPLSEFMVEMRDFMERWNKIHGAT